MNKQDVMTKIHDNVVLSQVLQYEPQELDMIIDQALTYPVGANRWRAYERLKRQASKLVGWNASQPELNTSNYYRAMIELIDQMLPLSSEGDIDDSDELIIGHRHNRGPVSLSDAIDEFMADLEKRRQRWLEGHAG